MIHLRLPLPLAIAAPFLLAGCAGSTSSFPSLAPRAVEQPRVETTAETAATPLDPAILGKATALVAQAQAGDVAFTDAVRAGCPAIDRGQGAAEGGEAWVAAQQALSVIEARRQPTTTALDDLNGMVLDQARLAEAGTARIDLTPLTTAAEQAGALDTAQSARLSDLRARGCRP